MAVMSDSLASAPPPWILPSPQSKKSKTASLPACLHWRKRADRKTFPSNTPTFVQIPRPPASRPSTGASASFAFNPRNFYGFAGEFSGYHIGQIGRASVSTDLFTYMFGPQLYFHHYRRFTPFAQELLGVAHNGSSAFSAGTHNSFAMALGGGVDVPFRGHISLRFGPVDYLWTQFPEVGSSRRSQNNLRVSGGVRWRF